MNQATALKLIELSRRTAEIVDDISVIARSEGNLSTAAIGWLNDAASNLTNAEDGILESVAQFPCPSPVIWVRIL